MLRVEAVHKSFENFKAVNGARLNVERGDLVAVIGPNGAGKTTLFNMITGQFKPDKGEIFYRNENITRLPVHQICRRGLARSFQIANIYSRLNVFRNVQVSVLSRKKMSTKLFYPAHKLAVDETNQLLKRVGLLDKAEVIAGSLSHGDQRILEIGIALGNEPEMLILDEPTAGMSPDETKATMSLIKTLADTQGLTILFCEHDMDIVFNVATNIMVMRNGSTIVQGKPEEVKANSEVQDAYLGGADA
jgi:branched-chain amino acid transport system ATP-binding protein